MGKRGPAPTPTNLRVLRGDRKDRINTSEPQPLGEVVCPEWLSADARQVWDRLAPDLQAKRVLTSWDVDTLAAFCTMVVAHRDASVDLDRNGTRIVTPMKELADGSVIYSTVKNPNWQVAREAAALMVTLGGRFGLNPSDRSQLSTGDGSANRKTGEDLLSG